MVHPLNTAQSAICFSIIAIAILDFFLFPVATCWQLLSLPIFNLRRGKKYSIESRQMYKWVLKLATQACLTFQGEEVEESHCLIKVGFQFEGLMAGDSLLHSHLRRQGPHCLLAASSFYAFRRGNFLYWLMALSSPFQQLQVGWE